jgi:hypothetical protein
MVQFEVTYQIQVFELVRSRHVQNIYGGVDTPKHTNDFGETCVSAFHGVTPVWNAFLKTPKFKLYQTWRF